MLTSLTPGPTAKWWVATVRILEGQLFCGQVACLRTRAVGKMEPEAERMPSDGRMGPRDEVFTAEAWSRRNPYGAGICYVQRAKRAVAGCLVTVRYQVWSKAGPVTSPAVVRRRAICSVCWNMITYGPSSCRRRCRSR